MQHRTDAPTGEQLDAIERCHAVTQAELEAVDAEADLLRAIARFTGQTFACLDGSLGLVEVRPPARRTVTHPEYPDHSRVLVGDLVTVDGFGPPATVIGVTATYATVWHPHEGNTEQVSLSEIERAQS